MRSTHKARRSGSPLPDDTPVPYTHCDPCDRDSYRTRSAARGAAKRRRYGHGLHLRPEECPNGQGWHLYVLRDVA